MCEVNFSNLEISIFFFNLSKLYSAHFFFQVSSFLHLCVTKRYLSKKTRGPGLAFLDAIDGKKWVMFVAMQQDSATLIYDLNTMKKPVASYLEK